MNHSSIQKKMKTLQNEIVRETKLSKVQIHEIVERFKDPVTMFICM